VALIRNKKVQLSLTGSRLRAFEWA